MADDLLSNNTNLSDSLHEMIQTTQSIQEEAVNTTNQQEELNSMSFALDAMFNVDEHNGSNNDASQHNDKHKNNNGFSNGGNA
jgi:hypothetical protein